MLGKNLYSDYVLNLNLNLNLINMNQKTIYMSQWTHRLNLKYMRRFIDVQDVILACYIRSFIVVCPLGCRTISKLLNGQKEHFRLKPRKENDYQ